MKVLGLDISSKTGWALGEADANVRPQIVETGRLDLGKKIDDCGQYPWSFLEASDRMALMIMDIVWMSKPDVIVIEETNLGRDRYAQKFLEFVHRAVLLQLKSYCHPVTKCKVVYYSTSDWRSALGLKMTTEDRKNNKKLKQAKQSAQPGEHLDKKALGVRGKVTPKHLALRYVKDTFGIDFKVKDNDRADAICLVAAFFTGAQGIQ